MKTIKYLTMTALVCLVLCSCSNNFKSEVIGLLNDATEKMENASDADEGKEINDELCKQCKELEKKYSTEDVLKLSESDQKEIDEAYDKYMKVREEKCGTKHLFMELPTLFENSASKAIENAADELGESVDDAMDDAQDQMNEAMDDAEDQLGNAMDDAQDQMNEAMDDAQDQMGL